MEGSVSGNLRSGVVAEYTNKASSYPPLTLRGTKGVSIAEEYLIVVEGRRWKFLPWPRTIDIFQTDRSFSEVRDFVDGLRRDYSNDPYRYTYRVGVERNNRLMLVH